MDISLQLYLILQVQISGLVLTVNEAYNLGFWQIGMLSYSLTSRDSVV